MLEHYRLDTDGRTPIQCSTLETLGEEYHRFRLVGQTAVGKATVSTVFLSLDHNHDGVGPPILWETMVFGEYPPSFKDEHGNEYQKRYSTYQDAALGHAAVVSELTALTQPKIMTAIGRLIDGAVRNQQLAFTVLEEAFRSTCDDSPEVRDAGLSGIFLAERARQYEECRQRVYNLLQAAEVCGQNLTDTEN